jgi:hypothetical protein
VHDPGSGHFLTSCKESVNFSPGPKPFRGLGHPRPPRLCQAAWLFFDSKLCADAETLSCHVPRSRQGRARQNQAAKVLSDVFSASGMHTPPGCANTDASWTSTNLSDEQILGVRRLVRSRNHGVLANLSISSLLRRFASDEEWSHRECTMCGCHYSKPKPADADRGLSDVEHCNFPRS